ncbi:MAG: Unknown protein [uncultured Sulfurovum sp.]|uniref:Uncharacterized protein n=1 Tax=uncultured Sulfurovum sp. TaxID=269237 RepID=A0A6S6TMI3_9BACT|nr:MAG: Unknown protein [uncultured Sulfurovum sp.]
MKKSLEERQEEIENYIISNELTLATKSIINFVDDFSKNKNFRREALLYKSSVHALESERRQYGKSLDLDRQLKQLSSSLLEFIEIVAEDSKGK